MCASSNVLSFVGLKAASDLELALLPEKGLPLAAVQNLKDQGLTFTEISEIVISPRTLKHRKARREKLSSVETDRVLRVARIVDLADRVFGSRMKALLWLRSVDDRLDDRTPMQMLANENGGRLIESMLWQIDEGIYT
ncbi:MAG: antitoxin Xre-like helix-turn-helix domain-containing protein [Terracidiphilus sp.]|jgi:putative toxin-antitoxin system antitoxin component (TIGR02293 family)